MAKDKAVKEEIVEESEVKPKKKPILLIVIILVVLLAGGGGAAWYFTKDKAAHPAKEEVHKSVPPVFEKLEVFTVNLAGGDRFLQVEMSMKIADIKVSEEIKLRMPEIRDSVLRLLSSKQAEELASVEGKTKLSEEIKKQVNHVLGTKKPEEGVLAVLFLSFIIQ